MQPLGFQELTQAAIQRNLNIVERAKPPTGSLQKQDHTPELSSAIRLMVDSHTSSGLFFKLSATFAY